MSGPLYRFLAAGCLAWLALTVGSVCAESIKPDVPECEYPELMPLPAESSEVPDFVPGDEEALMYNTSIPGESDLPTDLVSLLPVTTEGGFVWTYEGVEYRCTCVVVTPPNPTPSSAGEEAQEFLTTAPAVGNTPEPSTLLLFGLGSMGLLLAHRRRHRLTTTNGAN